LKGGSELNFPTLVLIPIAVLSLVLTLAASELLVRGAGRLAVKTAMAGGLVGLIIALCADSPEIASATIASAKGSAGAGIGVILGSNTFNLAMLLGAAAIVAGSVRVERPALLLNAGIGLAITVGVGLAIIGIIPLIVSWAVIALVFVPYVVLLWAGPDVIANIPLVNRLHPLLRPALMDSQQDGVELEKEIEEVSRNSGNEPDWWPVVWAIPAVAAIAVGALVLVQCFLTLGERWGFPTSLVGLTALAAATSLPNVYAAARLAHDGRSTAVVSATMNSNTLNLIAGFAVPALFLSTRGELPPVPYLLWLLAMTVVAICLLFYGLRRWGAFALGAMYVAFLIYAIGT
jgi:cation:H+ antiporter